MEYFICVGALSILVRATNTDDAIIVAKSYAIQKGYARPKLVSIKFPEGTIQYFCRVCGVEQVTIKESICEMCPQELGYADATENNVVQSKPIAPQNSRKNIAITQPQMPMTFVDFLKAYGGKWETIDRHFDFNSYEEFTEAEMKLDKMMREGETHLMNISFGDEFSDNCLNFQLQFGLEQKEIVISEGKIWEEQKFSIIKEAFEFMQNIVYRYFNLIPPASNT